MATAHKLERLTKWASRPEWHEAMENLLDSHVFLVTDVTTSTSMSLRILSERLLS